MKILEGNALPSVNMFTCLKRASELCPGLIVVITSPMLNDVPVRVCRLAVCITTVWLAAALVVRSIFLTFLPFSSRVTTKFWAKASCPSSP